MVYTVWLVHENIEYELQYGVTPTWIAGLQGVSISSNTVALAVSCPEAFPHLINIGADGIADGTNSRDPHSVLKVIVCADATVRVFLAAVPEL